MATSSDLDQNQGMKGVAGTEDAFQSPGEGERLTYATAPDEKVESMEEKHETHDLQTSYDRVAGEYAGCLYDELDHKPLDRALLARFVEETRGLGPVCDLGCGPGHVARYLHDLGAEEVFGLDLSTGMVETARRLNPGIEFQQGDMLSLDAEDGSLGAIVAFYSIVHIPRGELPRVLREIRRVLVRSGLLLLSFHIGEETRHLDELWGKEVSLDFHFLLPQEIEGFLEGSGFGVEDVIQRPPYGEDVEAQTRRAYVFARKHGGG